MQRYPVRYLIPNAITAASLTLGVVSMIHSMGDSYRIAAWLIVMSVLFDKLDGTVARALKASSQFGLQLDSFSDFVTFGLAPGFLLLSLLSNPVFAEPYYVSQPVGYWGLRVVVVFFILMSCLRLAKFNVLTEAAPGFFFGVPTTLCGALLSTYVLTALYNDWPPLAWHVLPAIYAALGVLMVSDLRIPKVALPANAIGRVLIVLAVATTYTCGLLWIFPEILLAMAVFFFFFGIGYGLIHLRDTPGAIEVEAPADPVPPT
jgi:CDP-diacylglycerol--serine O-phosphatidyltransferase